MTSRRYEDEINISIIMTEGLENTSIVFRMRGKDKVNQFKVFKKKNFLFMFVAAFTSQMGSVIGLTAFMFYLLKRFSHQPFLASLTELMYSLPMLFVFFIIGVLSDRMDRQKIAYHSEWLCGLLSLFLFFSLKLESLPVIFLVLFVRSAISKFFSPAEQSLIQGILTDDEYTTASGLNQMTGSLFMIFGSALGIFIFWTVGVEGAIIVDMASFLVSSFLIRQCKIEREVRLPNGAHQFKDLNLAMILKDFSSGFLYILKHRLLLTLISGFFIFGVVNGVLSVLPLFMLKYTLAPGSYEGWAVWLGIVMGSGILLGSFFASVMGSKMRLRHMIVCGLVASGGFIVASGFAVTVIGFLIISFVGMFFLPLINIAIGGWLPRIVHPSMMGRVQGCITPLMMVSQSATLGIISLSFPAHITTTGMFVLVGSLLIIVGAFYFFMLSRFDENKQLIPEGEKIAVASET